MRQLGCICLMMFVSCGVASADFGFQTTPILGTYATSITGDLVVITGPTPINPVTGLPYRDVDNNIVLGPTIPHYSISGDPLEGVGSPSMTLFTYWADTMDPVYGFCDPDVFVHSGSGVNMDTDKTYHYKGVFSFLEPGLEYSIVAAENFSFSGAPGFVMLHSSVGYFWPEDAGSWKYTETWWENETTESITFSRDFETRNVPEPFTVVLLGAGLAGLAVATRRRKKS